MKFIRMTYTIQGYTCLETSFVKTHKISLHGYGTTKAESLLRFCQAAGMEISETTADKILKAVKANSFFESPGEEENLAMVFREYHIDLRFLERGDGSTFWAAESMTCDLAPWDEASDDGSKIRVSFLPIANEKTGSSIEMISRTILSPDKPSVGRTSVVLENQGQEGPRAGLAMRFHPLENGGFPFYDEHLAGCTDEPQIHIFTDPSKSAISVVLENQDEKCFRVDDTGAEEISIKELYPDAGAAPR